MTQEFDAFISHASEDKETIARPLATKLSEYGLKIWFDEFTLEVGDSLIESIDKGLASSRFGIVILSRSFLEKGWTKYELKGLLTREIGKGKIVLPVWHNISRDEIMNISPTLADKFALLSPNQTIDEIALRLIQVIRPDIFEHISRYAAWLNLWKDSEVVYKKVSEIIPAPIRHEKLPPSLLLRIKLVHEILREAYNVPFSSFVSNFQRDMHPQDEVTIWERIAVAYLGLIKGKELSHNEKTAIFADLLGISVLTKDMMIEKLESGDADDVKFITAYIKAIPDMDDLEDTIHS